jgi:putative FmdB family regulatory protein
LYVPVYSYACKDCGHGFEQRQAFTDASLTVCPRCEGNLRKVFNTVGVVFKGSGFYRTDSRTEARATRANAGGAVGKDGSARAEHSGAGKGTGEHGAGKGTGEHGGAAKASAATAKAPAKSAA